MLRSCYAAPCRFYPDGPLSRIEYYFCDPDAEIFTEPNLFWGWSQDLNIVHNAADGPGESTGYRARAYRKGENTNQLPGDHYEGEKKYFLGNLPVPWSPVTPTPIDRLPMCDASAAEFCGPTQLPVRFKLTIYQIFDLDDNLVVNGPIIVYLDRDENLTEGYSWYNPDDGALFEWPPIDDDNTESTGYNLAAVTIECHDILEVPNPGGESGLEIAIDIVPSNGNTQVFRTIQWDATSPLVANLNMSVPDFWRVVGILEGEG